MNIFIYRTGYKVRSKADAEHLLNAHDSYDFGLTTQDIYWCDGKMDYRLDPVKKQVSTRLMSERGNMFSPYLVLDNPVDVIWKNRKYINSQIFGEWK